MSEEKKNVVLLLSACCGKGAMPAKKLHRALKEKGIDVIYEKIRPRQAEGILTRYGIPTNTQDAYVYVNDILIPAEQLKNEAYFLQILNQLTTAYLSKIIKK